jgi:hypothetical protein
MREYTVTVSPFGNEIISYKEDGVLYSFMADPANTYYQEYLKSLDEASTL